MSKLRLGPINAATPTPLKPDGSFDKASAVRLMKRCIDIKLDGVFIMGSMGEGTLLSEETRNAYVETALDAVGDKLVVFAGAIDVSPVRIRERALRYAKMGAHCVVMSLPQGRTPAGAIAEIKAIADACPVPCAYYDAPGQQGITLVRDEMLDLLSHPNIPVCKDSSGNPLIAKGLTMPGKRPDCFIVDGSEYRTVFSAEVGYNGLLHGGGVLTGRRIRAIWEKANAGQLKEAFELDRDNSIFLATIYNRFSRPLQNTLGQKYALKLLGVFDHETVILDQHLDDASRARIAKAVEADKRWIA